MTLITCVHQGYELYGSDRCFVESIEAIREQYPQADIEVVLPRSGPIVAELEKVASRVVIEPVWVLRRRNLPHLATFGLLALPGALWRAARRIRRSDVTYINTTVVMDYLLAAGLFPGRTIAHVHEIPKGAVMAVLGRLVRWSNARVIFNSRATARAYALPSDRSSRVIYNGINGPDEPNVTSYDGQRPLRLLMLGRINRGKGQEVLIDAIRQLPDAIRQRLEVRIVGSAFENKAKEEELKAYVEASGLQSTISLMPFQADPAEHYRWADVVSVPSREPESLGRVAIEAMAYGVPPVVSDIGGLPEVVEHGRTGWVVPPGRADLLSETLAGIVTNPEAWQSFGEEARLRYQMVFDPASVRRAIQACLSQAIANTPPSSSRRSVLNGAQHT